MAQQLYDPAAIDAYLEAIASEIRHGKSRSSAAAEVAKKNSQLRERFVEHYNLAPESERRRYQAELRSL